MAISHRAAPAPRLVRGAVPHARDAGDAVRFRILAQVRHFGGLRRLLGPQQAAALMAIVVERISAQLPLARVEMVARDIVEIDFESVRDDALSDALGRVRGCCIDAVELDGGPQRFDLLIGAATGTRGGDEVVLVEEAEAALVEARSRRPFAIQPFESGFPHVDSLAAEIDRALDRNEMVLHYQPKVHVRREEITSAEALIRWRHPEHGMVLPGDFIPATEQAQRIDRLTLWALRQAIEDQRRLRAHGHDLRIFINITGQLLADTAFAEAACACIKEAPDAQIGFEVTETSVIRDPEAAIANLQRFDRSGVRVSIDDYGAGLSSLAYLKQLPARELKIDKLFITQLTSSNRDPLIVRSTIDLAHALDLEVVAEGVETHAALALLTVMGCDMVQGYLISRPIPIVELISFLAEERSHRAVEQTRASFTRLAATWKRA